MCADELVGGSNAKTKAWTLTYRAIDHKFVKSSLLSQEVFNLDRALKDFGSMFAQLQEKRHQADYDPAPFRHNFKETIGFVELAEKAIAILEVLPTTTRRTLATMILFKSR
jgi:hypothetical protein